MPISTTPVSDFFDITLPKMIQDALKGAPDLPLVADALKFLPLDQLKVLSDLEQQISSHIQNLDTASAIASAIQLLQIQGLSASTDGAVVNISIHATDTVHVDLPDPGIQLGANSGTGTFGFTASADFDGKLTPTVDVTLAFDTGTGKVDIVDNPTTHNPSDINVDFGVLASNVHASANLGVMDATVTDNDPDAPIVDVNADLKFQAGHLVPDVSLGAKAALDFHLVTALPTGLTGSEDVLPKLFADVKTTWALTDSDVTSGNIPTPDFYFKDVGIDVKSLLEKLESVIGPVGDFFDHFPFGQILDALSDPIPVIDPLVNALAQFDPSLKGPIPLPNGDDVFNLLDVIALKLKSDAIQQGTDATPALTALSEFAIGLSIVQYIRQLNDAVNAGNSFGDIVLGSFDLADTSKFEDGPTPDQLLGQLSGILNTDLFTKGLDAFKNIAAAIPALADNPLVQSLENPDVVGFSFPVFEHPEQIIQALFGGAPASIVQFDLPRLGPGPQEFGPYVINVLGPIALRLDGMVDAGIDFAVGYDTEALKTGHIESGIYLATGPTVDGHVPHLAGETHNYMPAAYVWSEVDAGLGVGLSDFGGVFVQGGLKGNVDAFFKDEDGTGRVHFDSIASGCIFEPVEGKLTLGISAVITIGLGDFFSWSKEITLASATLIDFSFGCDGSGTLKPDDTKRLATQIDDTGPDVHSKVSDQGPADLNGPDLRLNVGTHSDALTVHGQNLPPAESFFIHTAVNSDGVPMDGVLIVTTTTITETDGSETSPIQKIVADFAGDNDSLTIDPNVTQAAEIQGGDGNDYISSGAGDDTLWGGNDNDQLLGGGGYDHIYGESGNDFLDGGPGTQGDYLDGGDDFDQVTYEKSPGGVRFTYDPAQNAFIGTGGDAQNDTLKNIEYIVGSHFNDVLFGNPSAGNTLEGLEGNDILWGGSGDDYLIGGPGGDWINGLGHGDHGNATSYLGSTGQVHIDLANGVFYGGDADGDTLINIQNVQGSTFDDVLIGTAESNMLDGFLGNDIIRGNGGHDTLIGGAGDDTIFASGGGATLDGGDGTDLLSYRDHQGAVPRGASGCGRRHYYPAGHVPRRQWSHHQI